MPAIPPTKLSVERIRIDVLPVADFKPQARSALRPVANDCHRLVMGTADRMHRVANERVQQRGLAAPDLSDATEEFITDIR